MTRVVFFLTLNKQMKYYVFSLHKNMRFVGLPRLQAVYRLMTTDNLVKHGFLSTLDVCLMHGTNGTFLPRGGNGTNFFSVWLLDRTYL